MHKVQESVVPRRFALGTCVRVKIGVMDPDFPDMHLGNWTGTVSQVQTGEPASYLIRWRPETLERVRPAVRDCCEKEDIALNKMWLLDEDLEPAARAPLP